ncbi:glutamate receptor ionotropic, kainate 2 [Stomoxys calcitrans]|uniref:glutamate receptor ionotropic, kainate 2 n=1 Tax=Stomoxys calcitrans TaxID=35570 RepID=UPI0027E218EA|nr:glutamate receptor ionotropic, kainate 2 [Stomoxys calcitrans]
MGNFLIILIFAITIYGGNGQRIKTLNIGALFYDDEYEIEESFVKTINLINSQNEVHIKLNPLIRRLYETEGSAILENKAVSLVENGVAAIFGPSSKTDSDIVSLLCNATGIPHILFDYLSEENDMLKVNHRMTINVFPSQAIMSKAYADIVQNFVWKKFTIVYNSEDASAPYRLQDLLQLKDINEKIVRVRTFKRGGDYRILWKSIKGERRVVLDCPPDILVDVLNASIPFGITAQFSHMFLTNLNTQMANFDDLRDNVTFAVNITAARLKLRESLNEDMNVWNSTDLLTMKLLPDLVHDAVMLFYLAVKNISVMYKINPPQITYNYQQEVEDPWPMGLYINRIMKVIASSDDSHFHYGFMQFDDSGHRNNFTLDIYEPVDNYLLATWDTDGHISQKEVEITNLKKIVYKVATRIGEPYFMLKEDAENRTGNDRYVGYAVDLITEIANVLKFDFLFVPVADNNYGKLNKETNQWDGIIGELINNDAHMGICDLTITQKRKAVVDFTVPFMQLGISILAYEKPIEQKPWNAFMEPFTNDVWVYVMISIFIIAFLFLFMARVSSSEWQNPHACNKDPEVLENTWDISNSFWLTMGSIMTAGSDILPRSAPMRTFNAMWWIFAIIVTNSYTANLAAFLTNSKMEGDIKGVEDLAKQSAVKFGTIQGGSTYTLFSESNETTFRLAYNMMQSEEPSVYTKTNDEGVERVLKNNGTYMFLMETTSLEYNTERNCKLKMLGETFGEKHYAIAVPFGAEYRSNLSVAILKLGELGKLFELKKKWWSYENNDCPQQEQGTSENNDLNFSEVRGIFYTLFVGIFVAYVVGITEFLIYVQHVAAEEKLTYKEALIKELKFVMKVWNNKKPITPGCSTRASSHMSGSTDKSSKSSKSRRSEMFKIDSRPELLEARSIKSLKSAIVNNIRDPRI